MRLYEHESKVLLQNHSILVPKGVVLISRSSSPFLPCVVKAQVLFGKRAFFIIPRTASIAAHVVGERVSGEVYRREDDANVTYSGPADRKL